MNPRVSTHVCAFGHRFKVGAQRCIFVQIQTGEIYGTGPVSGEPRSRLGQFAMRQSGTAVKRLRALKIFTRLIPKLQIIGISKGKPAPCNHGCLMTELAEYNNVCLNVSQQVSGSNQRADRIFPLICLSL